MGQSNKTDCESIGARIKERRERQGITQGTLAKLLSVSRELVNQWERGARDLKTGQIIALSETLKTTCEYLLRGIEPENVEMCARTGLSQKSIDCLSRYADDKQARIHFKSLADTCVPARMYVINALLQDENMLDELADNAIIAASAKSEPNGYAEQASQYLAGLAFADHFKRYLNNNFLNEVVANYVNAHDTIERGNE